MYAIKLENNEVKYIPDWIVEKNLDQNQIYAVRAEGEDAWAQRETEKAILAAWTTEYGKVSLWVPKSVLKSKEQAQAEYEAEATRMKKKAEAYDKLVATAHEAGLKDVRNHMKVDTIVAKAKAAGKFDAIKSLVKPGKGGKYILAD